MQLCCRTLEMQSKYEIVISQSDKHIFCLWRSTFLLCPLHIVNSTGVSGVTYYHRQCYLLIILVGKCEGNIYANSKSFSNQREKIKMWKFEEQKTVQKVVREGKSQGGKIFEQSTPIRKPWCTFYLTTPPPHL